MSNCISVRFRTIMGPHELLVSHQIRRGEFQCIMKARALVVITILSAFFKSPAFFEL
jgi:hypothetical protein